MRGRLTTTGKIVLIFVLAGVFLLWAEIAHCQKIAVLPGEFTPGGAPPAANIAAAMDDATGIWKAAGATQSYVIGPTTEIVRDPTGCNQAWSGEAAQKAQAAGLTWDKVIFLQQYDNLCRYGGEASIGGCCAYENSGNNPYVIAHETGHMIGLPHSWGAFFAGTVGDFAHAQIKEYGDPIDVMSGGDTVQAIWRFRLGWLSPRRLSRIPTQLIHLEPITAGQNAFVIQRDDGNEYWGELRTTGQAKEAWYIRATYNGVPTWVATLLVGEEYTDTVGGNGFRPVGPGDIVVTTFAPTYVPPAPPTPSPFVTPPPQQPTPCFVAQIIPCTPVPTPATATPSLPEPTATPTATAPPEATETPAPEPTPTTTPTEAPPAADRTPTPAPTSPPSTVPGLPRPRGGCGFAPFSIALIGWGYAWWRRRIGS